MDSGFFGFSGYSQSELRSDPISDTGSDQGRIHFLPNTALPDHCDFSQAPLLGYISDMLMEEDMEEQAHMLQESLRFQAKEKSFYDVIGKKYPPSPQQPELSRSADCVDGCPYLNGGNQYALSSTSSDGSSGYLIDIVNPAWINTSNNSLVQFDSFSNVNRSVWDFRNGVEGPSQSLSTELVNGESDYCGVKRNHHSIETHLQEEEERVSKLPALNTEFEALVGEFDSMLLNSMGEGREKFGAYREDLKNTLNKDKKKGAGGRTARAKRKQKDKKKEVIDLRTLLLSCAQAVAADDSQSANEHLKHIRQHSSPCGDANQRLAHYFSEALEARLAGGGSRIYKSIVGRKTSIADYLRAYYTSLASAPFNKVSNLAINRTIINRTGRAKKVHIIDFGIMYGFQWPNFIHRISKREKGPPMVKITGIDFPQPGFKPAKWVEDTGKRLARYAEKFNVPFEYNAIAQKWETIKVEDLKIKKDEFLVVTCMYRFKNLSDETVVAHSSRTMVLDLIRKISPDIFVHGIVNGTYGAPFFLTRFREVLYQFSAMFDMLEACVPREVPERTVIEREIYGKEAFNVVACEGWERVERPETYKQWQARNLKAGFVQVAFDQEIIQEATEKGKMFFHKDFMIDEQGKWILLGWRGRTINAISCWKPVRKLKL